MVAAARRTPQKWIDVPEYEKIVDLEHRRMRIRQRQHSHFVFAAVDGYLGRNVTVAALDGEVAYNRWDACCFLPG